MIKRKSLKKEEHEVQRCHECKIGKSGFSVFGEGNPNSKIVFVGEAPGFQESLTGRPFIGRSGQYLTALLTSIGINRKDVYITSPVKYYPGRRTPTPVEIKHGKTHLDNQLEIIRPQLIVLLGNVAATSLIAQRTFLTQNHGKVIKKNGRSYFLTFHPAAALRFPKIRKLTEEDFKKLATLIDTYYLSS